MRTKEIEIVKGWYWTAGRQYGWADTYEMEGVGLNRELFESDRILVTVKGIVYEVDTEEAKAFIKRYNSHNKLGDTKVGYISKSIMKQQQ